MKQIEGSPPSLESSTSGLLIITKGGEPLNRMRAHRLPLHKDSNAHPQLHMASNVIRGLLDCWTVWMPSIMLYVLCACPLDVGIVFVFLRPVSPTQCRVGI